MGSHGCCATLPRLPFQDRLVPQLLSWVGGWELSAIGHLWHLLSPWREPQCARSLLLQKTRCIPRLVIFKGPFQPRGSPWACLSSCYCTAAQLLLRLILLPSHSTQVLILTTIPQIFLYTKFQLGVNFLGNLTCNVNTYSYTAVHTLKDLVQVRCMCLPELPSLNIQISIHRYMLFILFLTVAYSPSYLGKFSAKSRNSNCWN